MGREGNTLSPVLRQAWEGATLRTMTKGTPAKATGAHVSIVAHITAEELRQKLSATETLSGFANRFLWVCAKRSKSLPRGGRQIEWRDSAQVEADPQRDQVRAAEAQRRLRRRRRRPLGPGVRAAGDQQDRAGRGGHEPGGGTDTQAGDPVRAPRLPRHDRGRAPGGGARGVALLRGLVPVPVRRPDRQPGRGHHRSRSSASAAAKA